MTIDQYGWIDASTHLPVQDTAVLVFGKGWISMAVAYYGNGYLRMNGKTGGDAGKMCWRYNDGTPLGLAEHSKPVTYWTNLPPSPIAP